MTLLVYEPSSLSVRACFRCRFTAPRALERHSKARPNVWVCKNIRACDRRIEAAVRAQEER